MIKKTYLLITILGIAVLAGIASGFVYFSNKYVEQIACTEEAKICPDGSAVGRTGPNCEFAECPDVVESATIKGKVEIGPICPVEREGVPCPVPPEAYTSREITLYASNGVTIIKRMNFMSDGTYAFSVPSGTYILNIPMQGIGGSADLPKTITVVSGQTVEFNFSIDTGIR